MSQGRFRTKTACEPCRSRKRKCDGQLPCNLCVRYEYDCYYNNRTRRRRDTRSVDDHGPPLGPDRGVVSPSTLLPNANTSSAKYHERNMVANAGTIFPQVLGASLQVGELAMVSAVGWNLELHPPVQATLNSPCQIMSLKDCQALTELFFEKVHPVYGCITPSTFEDRLRNRWLYPEAPSSDFDAVVCGIAALGAVFTDNSTLARMDRRLADFAKSILDRSVTTNHPSVDLIRAWLFRTIYLRITSTPLESWMASCITMHLIEDAGLHQEHSNRSLIYPQQTCQADEHDNHRRLFWLSRLLNTWISQEYGRSRVHIVNVNCEMPSPATGDPTLDLISLYRVSEIIDPSTSNDATALEQCLSKISKMSLQHDVVILSQSCLALALYRRLRVSTPSVSNANLATIIEIGLQGLEATLRLTDAHCPWWHVLNQPFQFTCILLAIDSKESLSHVTQAFTTLKTIVSKFDNAAARKAIEIAQLLVRICSERKQREASSLRELEFNPSTSGTLEMNELVQESAACLAGSEAGVFLPFEDETFAQILEEFDWDSFLNLPGSF